MQAAVMDTIHRQGTVDEARRVQANRTELVARIAQMVFTDGDMQQLRETTMGNIDH